MFKTDDLSGKQQQCCYLNTNEVDIATVLGKLEERFFQGEIVWVTFHFPSNMLHLPTYNDFHRSDETFSNGFFFFLVVFLLSSGFFIHSLTKPHPVKLSFVQFPVYWLIKLTRTNLANIYKPVGATNIARRFPKPSPT